MTVISATDTKTYATAQAISTLDPQLGRFATALNELRQLQALQTIAAHKTPAAYPVKPRLVRVKDGKRDYNNTGLAVDNWLKAMPADKRQKLLANFDLDAHLTPELKAAMQQMKIDLKSPVPVLEQADLKSRFSFVDAALIKKADQTRQFDERGVSASGNGAAASRAAVVNAGLKFRISKLVCNDETTSSEWKGTDDMEVGGTATDDKNNVTEIPKLFVGEFNDGDVKTYNPPRVLKTFNLSGTYPKTFIVFMAISERDSGGFATFLYDLTNSVEDEIDAVALAAGIAAGAAIGGTVGGPIGALVGAVGVALVSGIIGLIGKIQADEVFQPQSRGARRVDGSARAGDR